MVVRNRVIAFRYGVQKGEYVAHGKRKTTVQSLQRGLEILVAVAQADWPLGVTELSRHFGLAKGSISRLVATLVICGFLPGSRDGEGTGST